MALFSLNCLYNLHFLCTAVTHKKIVSSEYWHRYNFLTQLQCKKLGLVIICWYLNISKTLHESKKSPCRRFVCTSQRCKEPMRKHTCVGPPFSSLVLPSCFKLYGLRYLSYKHRQNQEMYHLENNNIYNIYVYVQQVQVTLFCTQR